MKHGTKVRFQINGKDFTGSICGKSRDEQPIIGAVYIIAPDADISSEEYPYTHLTLPEVLITECD